jgi:tRNA A58 N-methylase Trm61
MSWVEPADSDITGSRKVRGAQYQATKAKPFKKLLGRMDFPAESCFVDFGSGKGRILLITSQYPFKRVVGVEYSRELCKIARQNLEAFRKRAKTNAPVEIVLGDAADYRIREDDNVFYFYNPFGKEIMTSVVTNIARSVKQNPRKVWLIYYIPLHRQVIESIEPFEQQETFVSSDTEFLVYSNKSSSQ